jgi:hypothetical protein
MYLKGYDVSLLPPEDVAIYTFTTEEVVTVQTSCCCNSCSYFLNPAFP